MLSMFSLLCLFSLDMFFGIFFFKSLLLLFRLKNILIMLFGLEFMMMKLLFSFMYLSMPFDAISMLIFLGVAAGEASLGLSMLMSMLRQMGKDKFLAFNHPSLEGF